MAAHKGHPKYGGRQKGTPNKSTTMVKEALQLVYDKIGGHEAFANWAMAERTEFYKLYAKLLPLQLSNDESGNLVVQIVKHADNPAAK